MLINPLTKKAIKVGSALHIKLVQEVVLISRIGTAAIINRVTASPLNST